jgi:8-hydroxy-5-deazaflavin:NADPH oxidoreductase
MMRNNLPRLGEHVTAIIGVGNIGGALARHLAAAGESVTLAAKDESRAEPLADELGPLARAAPADDGVAGADAVVFALWLDTIKELIPQHARLLEDKVVIDPSNPVAFYENGQIMRTLPPRQSAGSVVAALLPTGALREAFGTLGADALAAGANREPRRAVLFYATDAAAAAPVSGAILPACGG